MSHEPASFRAFDTTRRPSVEGLYRENHARQTVAEVRRKRAEFLPLRHRRMGIWEAIESLDSIVDDSDPDLGLSQLDHALQTAESLRTAGAEPWLVVTGFVHDLGKVLCTFGEPQWAVVGDTFPVGCAFDQRIVHAELFAANADRDDPRYASRTGIYTEGCGLDQVLMSWGHDEYLYHVLRDHLPAPALAIIRYHSFYAAHQDGAYGHLMDDADRERMHWVRRFNAHDLYSKSESRPDWPGLRPIYERLVADHLPNTLDW